MKIISLIFIFLLACLAQAKGPRLEHRTPYHKCRQNEPTVEEVVKAVWLEVGLRPEQDLEILSRVKLSGWFPKVSAGVSNDIGDRWDYRYEPGTPRVDQMHEDVGFRWDASLSWDLSKIAFQSAEVQVLKENARRSRERMDLAAEVIRIYFLRKGLMTEGMPQPRSKEAYQLQQATATLDAWTNGRFHRRWCEVKI
jgi:hypothetical protein